MKILVSGAGGLVGSSLVPSLSAAGHRVVRLARTGAPRQDAAILWDPARGGLDAAVLDGFDAVIHLAGESIAAGRWSAARKQRIRDSRVNGTTLLAEGIARAPRPPRVLLCASAVGFYGDRGAEVLREDSRPGSDFLSEVCRAWEAASEPAVRKGVRVALHRFGVILSPAGGALKKMLPPFRLGLGGRLGDGRQFLPWIAIDDVLGILERALTDESLKGPINCVAPQAVTNADFTRTLARVLERPAVFPMPAMAARLLFGEMAEALLLASQRVEPARLMASGYRFRYAELEPALRHLLGRPAPLAA